MSDDSTKTVFCTQEDRKKGGQTRAANLSPERRREIAILASNSRKDRIPVKQATHFSKLLVGNKEITCAVLEGGQSVVTESSVYKLLGLRSGGRKKKGGAQIPRFLNYQCLQEYIPECLGGCPESFNILLPKGSGKAYAYEAEKTAILKMYYRAWKDKKLTKDLDGIGASCEVILMALADVGLVGLIYEATGYEKVKENNELQKLFQKFIAKELQPWVKRFPDEFFSHLKRIYGMEEMKGNPIFFGHLINTWIYKKISPEVLLELKKINPVDKDLKKRRYPHHQFLTPDIGCPTLQKQVQKVTNYLALSDSTEDFIRMMERSDEMQAQMELKEIERKKRLQGGNSNEK